MRVKVNGARQWNRLMALAELGAIAGCGVNRAALTALDSQARRLVIGWAATAGATASVDAAGNLWLRREGRTQTAAPILTGSHLDSQPEGGRFDGAYGVIAGLEVLSTLHDAGITPRRPIEVVAWTNEEGGRFAPGCTGSMSWSGFRPHTSWNAVTDSAGITYGEALAESLARETDLPRRPLLAEGGQVPHAYIEAHIEQGPILERAGLQIGVVTAIQGSRWFRVTLTGASAHAGTAPLSLRRDALQDAIRAISALNIVMTDPTDTLRFTIGRLALRPNSSNSVPGEAIFTIDVRHPDAAILTEKGDQIEATIRAAVLHCTVEVTETFHAMPASFHPAIIACLERAATTIGARYTTMPSGAFHDAQFAASVTKAAMLFVPCRDGISHNPAEYASPAQLEAGTEILAHAVLDLAEAV